MSNIHAYFLNQGKQYFFKSICLEYTCDIYDKILYIVEALQNYLTNIQFVSGTAVILIYKQSHVSRTAVLLKAATFSDTKSSRATFTAPVSGTTVSCNKMSLLLPHCTGRGFIASDCLLEIKHCLCVISGFIIMIVTDSKKPRKWRNGENVFVF